MSSHLQVTLFRLSDPRRFGLVLSLILFALALAGCGDIIPAAPSGCSGGGSCSGG